MFGILPKKISRPPLIIVIKNINKFMARFKGELTRGVIAHLKAWESFCKANSKWTKSDQQISDWLNKALTKINTKMYENQKAKTNG
jgi:hypothetical protein